MKVFLKFRSGESGVVSQQEAEKITDMFGEYVSERKDGLLKLPNGKRVRISDLQVMEDWKEPERDTLPLLDAMRESVDNESNPEQQTLKEAQMRIFQHNKLCVAKGKMEDFIWYYIENGKIMKSTKEEVGRRVMKKQKEQLLASKNVHHVTEVNGQLSIGVNHLVDVDK